MDVTTYRETFSLFYTLINNDVLLVPPVLLVFGDEPSSCPEFLSFLKCIYSSFKMRSKETKLYVYKSQNKRAFHTQKSLVFP